MGLFEFDFGLDLGPVPLTILDFGLVSINLDLLLLTWDLLGLTRTRIRTRLDMGHVASYCVHDFRHVRLRRVAIPNLELVGFVL